jgi:hypothetical protein
MFNIKTKKILQISFLENFIQTIYKIDTCLLTYEKYILF